ncbi:MAG: LysR family transcriptional regulator [Deltaproteobacteria bacterium]|nr:LysR family transcriptional regulator [Deltaproteobacteria bacterium]
MEIRHLRTFKTVATLLSFNKAAEQLHYAQSSISAQIQALEDELNVRLFDRLGRGILLTEAGERLLPYAQKMLDLSEETLADISETRNPAGALTIRVPESMATYRLPQVIKRFHRQFPKVKLVFTTCAHDGLQKDLRKGVTDLAFLLAEGIQAADLEAEVLGFEQIRTVVSPGHPLAATSPIRPKDLEGQTILLSKVDCSYRRIFEHMLKEHHISGDNVLTFQSVEALKACLMAGLGITILPEVAISHEIAQGRIVPLPWDEGTFEVAILMIWYKERWISPTLQAFMDMVKDELPFS